MRAPAGGPGFDAIKPRIFQIGFNKCGTRSFYDFFEKNGIKSVHFKRGELAKGIHANIQDGKPPLEGWDKWTGYTDMQWVKKTGVIEACGFYREFAAYYPRSYFILNTRSKDRWIKSRLNHGTGQNYGDRYRQGLGLSSMEETVEAWSDMWDKHHEEVARFFASTGQHFLIYNIEQDKPQKLVDFLAPDFKTDGSLFGHEGKTDTAKPAAKPNVMEEAATPYVTSARPKAVTAAPKADQLNRRFVPRNDIVSVDETAQMAPFEPAPITPAREGWSGNLIVSVVQNQGPYLLEWIAHHRAIGFNHFLMFSHDCADGTDQMLDHLAALGIVTHVPLDPVEGMSPQAAALENVMQHPTVFEADWITYLEPDEFVNIRTGNGTVACLQGALPDNVTNIAMTWRCFGSAGVEAFEDTLTLEQFDRCAPAYLPKPFSAWGFKTLTAMTGAYQSLSAHRPGNLLKEFVKEVVWVNGSGVDITKDRAKSGWRSDVKTVGYDLVQVNRYALRALDTFLLRCDMHPEGEEKPDLETWVGLDWNGHQDITIQRNLPRLQAELDRLKDNSPLSALHSKAVTWHREHIAELQGDAKLQALAKGIRASTFDDVSRVTHILQSQ